jgi:RNA polymerase sigma-70 factor (ECF subfamily)
MEIKVMSVEKMEECDLDFHRIHDMYQPKIFRYLSSLIDEYEAEDLTQEVFAKVSRNLGTFRGESHVSTWIYRIATNLAIDRIRYCTLPFVDSPKEAEEPIDAHGEIEDRNIWTGEKPYSAEQNLIRGEMTDCIRICLENLPETFRVVLVLSELENFRDKEIAEITGVTLQTVKIRLHRARPLLRTEIEKNCRVYWDERNELACEPTEGFLRNKTSTSEYECG